MSLFLDPYSAQTVDEEKIGIAKVQFDAMNTTFNTMLRTCLEKCIPHDEYGESDLNKGEMCCIDRCVAKIHLSNRLIGGFAQSRGFTPERHLPYDRFVDQKITAKTITTPIPTSKEEEQQ
ncbi:Tim12p [Kluyveromyces lactis]|uniref:Mitochondrial import inner membrane translocase subunit n=1 Tax=Kluyveromyces lactis (strain ATCC 8585 / CBS 2359 / DSM 70799 / NBRC 1267 / NRRL Y-1140 / WM37) TaxID=284590 RepID=Q6CVH4_KLULA|nr:uncharacterized protein KLLA0_B12034g [Kluyveromyces lactis]CAH02458.1 KLLA0B12034p [Kluyveromyces lactis]|eukprot:XP_452065.1 uncharacterized protein KLLA0_B12034g [Kluyveromyces lactis]